MARNTVAPDGTAEGVRDAARPTRRLGEWAQARVARPARDPRRVGRDFGRTIGAALVVFALLAWWKDRTTLASSLASAGLLLAVLGVFAPMTLLPVERQWMRLAHLMSKVTTPLLMGAIFFLVIAPIGIARRLFGYNALTHGRTKESAWIQRAPDRRRSNLLRQF